MALVQILVIVALFATIGALFLGLRSMSLGGAYDRQHGEKLMWERVAFQALAVLVLIAALFLMNS